MTSTVVEPLRDSVVPAKQGAKRHYGSHPYFTKRAWNVVQEYIKQFTAPGDTVLDPFGGSGVTAVESLVLERRALYADISEWACFLARQTAIAPVNIARLRAAFGVVEDNCRAFLDRLWKQSNSDLEKTPVADWYPKHVRLPRNSDVEFVEELFTPRMLHGLARLRAAIEEVKDSESRDLLRLAFSATLVRINRTFLSAEGRRESRGGSAIFSIYRYKVARRPVELPLWEQFATRVARLIEAKQETNQLIGSFYRDHDTAEFRHTSATRLTEWLTPESVDYVYTDPPYGGHIAYLDLSTMWTAWLGFEISEQDRKEEIIEGGDLRKSPDNYNDLMREALDQIGEVLKTGGWLSLVFAHRDTSYWQFLTEAARAAHLEYVNTVVQPVGVVWSMHKKKNPLRVLSGELVLNFRKVSRLPKRRPKPSKNRDPMTLVRSCCEKTIVQQVGATTEDLHHRVIPLLLESGLLQQFSRQCPDLTPFLQQNFEFDRSGKKWHLPASHDFAARIPARREELVQYYVLRFIAQSKPHTPTLEDVLHHIQTVANLNSKSVSAIARRVLAQSCGVTHERNGKLSGHRGQKLLVFSH